MDKVSSLDIDAIKMRYHPNWEYRLYLDEHLVMCSIRIGLCAFTKSVICADKSRISFLSYC